MTVRCPFCDRIKAGEYETWPGVPDPDVVWFEPLKPVTPGHLLFVPVRHVQDAPDDPYTSALVMEIASRWAQQHPSRADGWNFITSAGGAASQTVYHLHLHLIPRRAGDGLLLPWTLQQHGRTTMLRKALEIARSSQEKHVGDHCAPCEIGPGGMCPDCEAGQRQADEFGALLESLGGEG
jgi:histidine triad (HIT) family protein